MIEHDTADEIVVLIDNPDGLAWSPVQSMPNLVRYPLSDQRRERAGNQPQSCPPVWFSYLRLNAIISHGAFVFLADCIAMMPSAS